MVYDKIVATITILRYKVSSKSPSESLTSALFGLYRRHMRSDRLLEQVRQTLEGHVVVRDIHTFEEKNKQNA